MLNKSKKKVFDSQILIYWLILLVVIILAIGYFCLYYFLTVAEIKQVNNNELLYCNKPPILTELPWRKLLVIPTYDGSGQAVHPDILFFDKGFKGHNYYLAFTPYPFSQDQYENPSLLVSNDGWHFKETRSGLNPLVPQPALDHNDDPDLFFDYRSKQLWLYYLETLRPDRQNLVRLSSYDGVEWNKEKVFQYNLKNNDDFILSPALIEKAGTYYLFAISKRGGLHLGYYQSEDGKNWQIDNFTNLRINFADNFTPWHVDVFKGNEWYYLLVNGKVQEHTGAQELLIARSKDLNNWELASKSLLKPGIFSSQTIYRSTGLTDGTLLGVWFSFKTNDGRWQIGFEKFELASLFQ